MSNQVLQVIAVGDISFNGGYHRLLERRGFPTRLLSPMWAAADLRVGIWNRRSSQSAPKVEPSKLTLRAALGAGKPGMHRGSTAIALANNHTMDYGQEGMFETIDRLEGVGIVHRGVGRNASSACTPVILEREGQRIGLLAYCDASCGAATPARPGSPGVAGLDIDGCCAAIRGFAIRSRLGDRPDPLGPGDVSASLSRQRAQARSMVAAGADLILGHHPHILQPCGIAGVPVFYSLGNFLFSEMYWRGCNTQASTFVAGCGSIRTAAGWVGRRLFYARGIPSRRGYASHA